MQNIIQKTMKEQRVKSQRKTKKIIFKSKKDLFLGVIYFWRPQKKSKLRLFVSSQPEVLL